jgi:hypothetical protein
LPSTVLLRIAISIAGHQPIAPIRAKRIITGQTTPATVLTAVSTTEGGAVVTAGTMADPEATVPSTLAAFGSFSDGNEGCRHCGSGSPVDGALVTSSS